MQLLRSLGMPVIRADGNAATLCGLLAHQGMAYAAAVDDLTVLCFGGKLLCNLMDPPAAVYLSRRLIHQLPVVTLGSHCASCRDLHWQVPIVQDVLNIMKQKAQFKEDRVRRDCRTIADAMNGA
ncbi:hypothetical protein BC940DRAFT_314533 [Gongronella butleri]|nr:hypothetical protein BC940DRAFT_314533 [Gongronella butleri]